MGDFNFSDKAQALANAAVGTSGFDSWIGRAVLSSSANLEGEVFQASIRLMNVRNDTTEFMEFVAQLCSAAVHRGDNQLRAVLETLAAGAADPQPQVIQRWQVAALAGLVEGFGKSNPWKAKNFIAFLDSPP